MNTDRKKNLSSIAMIACLLLLPAVLWAQTANFDSLSEGIIGNEVVDGGITFYGLDNGQPGLENVFVIEHAEQTITDPNFSAPNALTATSYSPGAAAGYGAVKEMFMTTGCDADNASVQVFTAATLLGYNNTLTLEALKNGVVVDSVAMPIDAGTGNAFTLSVSGVVFDTLRLASVPNSQALLIDNVTIDNSNLCGCDLNRDQNCDLNDWALFGQDWGRTDCTGSQNICECDINRDGRCDINDWQLFGADWGRSDCR